MADELKFDVSGIEPGKINSLAGDYALTFERSTAVFDGHKFDLEMLQKNAALLHLAALARRGDELASEVLRAAKFTIYDAAGGIYWPGSGPG